MSLIIYLSIIICIITLFMSHKFRMFIAAVIMTAVFLFCLFAVQNAAQAEEIKQGIITRVAPESFNSYPILVVTVETFDGEIYTYYSEEEIDTEGVVILTLFGDEVLNVE